MSKHCISSLAVYIKISDEVFAKKLIHLVVEWR